MPGPLHGLRVGFAGTPEFAAQALQAILRAGATVPLVLTQPDRPAGRGMKLQASAVKLLAQQHGLPLAQPRSLRLDGKFPDVATTALADIQAAQLDVLVVAAYGLILPQWVLDAPRLGCLNIHASLLPRWRGAAPIHRAIEAQDAETGVTIMQMDAGLDTGNMLLVQRLPIEPTDTTGSLHDKLAALGASMVVQALRDAADGQLKPVKQPEEGITYAHKIDKAEGQLDWRRSAPELCAQVRAFNPAPGAWATRAARNGQAEEVWKLWNCYSICSNKLNECADNGLILIKNSCQIVVLAKLGELVLTELQRAGGKRLSAAEFLRGANLQPGDRLLLKPVASAGNTESGAA